MSIEAFEEIAGSNDSGGPLYIAAGYGIPWRKVII
jgi:hypothetical protein